MNLFYSIFDQMVFLFTLIAIGVILSKFKLLPDNAQKTVSKMENYLFIPCLVMHTFIQNCNVQKLASVWNIIVLSFSMVLILIPISLLVARFCFKEARLRKIATYGLAFSNFAFMGNAVMNAIFPEIFFEYTIFTLPFYFMIYIWGIPILLISDDSGEKVSFSTRLKSFFNPILIAMFIGLILGLTNWSAKLPTSVSSAIKVLGDCMSPLAMLLTGITIGQADIISLIKKWRIYLTSAIRLLAYPLITLGALLILPQNDFFSPTFFKCAMCMSAMPMGLNAIVIPAAYGKDTSDAAGLALISHLFSTGTIPLMFMLLNSLVL